MWLTIFVIIVSSLLVFIRCFSMFTCFIHHVSTESISAIRRNRVWFTRLAIQIHIITYTGIGIYIATHMQPCMTSIGIDSYPHAHRAGCAWCFIR